MCSSDLIGSHDSETAAKLQAYADKKAAGVRAARTDAKAFDGLPMAPAEALK